MSTFFSRGICLLDFGPNIFTNAEFFRFRGFVLCFLDFWRKNLNFFPVRRGGAHIIWFFSKFGKPYVARAPDILEKFFLMCVDIFLNND